VVKNETVIVPAVEFMVLSRYRGPEVAKMRSYEVPSDTVFKGTIKFKDPS